MALDKRVPLIVVALILILLGSAGVISVLIILLGIAIFFTAILKKIFSIILVWIFIIILILVVLYIPF
jgi:hypothetical protein